MSVTQGVPFSQLVQRPKDTVAKLEASPRRRLRLDRRDGEDLILESAARAEDEDRMLAFSGHLLLSVVQDEAGRRAMLPALPSALPWVRFLPERDVLQFLEELVETLIACADLDNIAGLVALIDAWKSTAEIYSDPELLRAATAPLDGTDYGEVPGSAER